MSAEPDFAYLYKSALQCTAAYIVDETAARAAFTALGYTVIGWYSDDSAQATLLDIGGGEADLVFSGTRFSEGTLQDHIGDLLRDINCEGLSLGGGVVVAREPYQGSRKVYQWAMSLLPAKTIINAKGHSLGGWQATYAVVYVPAERLGRMVALEPPKQGNGGFWWAYADQLQRLTTVVNNKDPWVGYPPSALTQLSHGDSPFIWLHDGTYSVITEKQWPGGELFGHETDHGPDTVIAALKVLADGVR